MERGTLCRSAIAEKQALQCHSCPKEQLLIHASTDGHLDVIHGIVTVAILQLVSILFD